ncbi:MAG: RNA polymerase factor sigma-54 [Planctomycetota bacterium]
MRLDVGLFQAQVQKQILSPQMIQSMEILVLNSQQLEERIEQALEENIALEVTEPEAGDGAGEEAGETDARAGTGDPELSGGAESAGEVEREIDLLADRYEHLAEFQSEDYYTSRLPRSGGEGEDEDRFEMLQNTEGRPETLGEHLLAQLRLRGEPTERERALAELLIHSLDARGYLLHSPEELLVALNAEGAEGPHPLAPVTEEELSAAHGIVRQLDPPGVGARDLIDCLLVQLERDPGDYPLETILVRDHLQDIARNRLPQISKATGATIDEVKEGIEIIRSLQPNPGASFSNEPTQVVRPDVFIEDDEGELVVTVTDGYLPRLRVSQHYRELLQASRKDPEVRDYLRKKIEGAEWLLSAIHQRKSTLQRVAEEVVAYQTEFFREGERALRPLKMQDIADKIGVNVSTVSRAISGKYFQAPGMVRELKSLFTGGTVKDDGSSESRGSVILRIKDLIADENPKKPLSDSKIVSLLAEDGIHISRRTVTKYREAEGIPSSRERRAY